MEPLFPFGLPGSTILYLALYLVTLVIHVLFMNYVLAGSGYLAAISLFEKQTPATGSSLIAQTLREWLPFMLSAAITAGIAPLLFVQILYKQNFYTANLLLFHRWMAILPVLIVAFYLLYLWKAKQVLSWPRLVTVPLGFLTFACFAFIAWSWTENHVLSVNEGAWSEHFAAGNWMYHNREVFPRLSVWFSGAFPTMALMLSWQLWYLQRDCPDDEVQGRQRLSLLALGGLLIAVVAALLYVTKVSPQIRETILSRVGLPYLFMAGCGCGVQFASWIQIKRSTRFERIWLITASAGLLMTLLGTAVIREIARWVQLNGDTQISRHQQAAEVGGLPVFLLFFVINIALMTYCIMRVKRGLSVGD